MVSSLDASQGKRVAKGFLVYVALGPPIGATVSFLEYVFTAPLRPGQLTYRDVLFFPVSLLLSYIVGLIPAAVAGVAVAFLNVRYRGLGWAHVAAIGLLSSVPMMFWAWTQRDPRFVPSHWYVDDTWWLVLICLVPTLACWRIIRRWRVETRFEGA
jgi:hypothetical protein